MTPIRQGFGFFPRSAAKAKEFGLDLKKHTHLFLSVQKPIAVPPRVVISPDDNWLAFTEVDLPPRIWEIKALGKELVVKAIAIEK